MPDRLTRLGTAAYALVAIVMGVQATLMVRRDNGWDRAHGWVFASLLAVVVLTGLLVAAGALTRRGLIADDGPWIFRNGWIVLVLLTAVNVVVSLLASSDQDAPLAWVTGPAVFLPHFVRRLEESYYDGVAEARAERDGERMPGS
jgi:hypothetical protein